MDKIRVYVAEKDEIQRKSLVDCLIHQGEIAVVGSSGDGLETLHMVTELMPDILICNIILPKYDVFAILDQLQMLPRKPKTIIVTTLEMDNTIHRAFSKGADEYLIKPVDSSLLIKKIYELVGREENSSLESMDGFENTCENTENFAQEERTRQTISTLFLRIGLPAHLLGYRFAQEAVYKLVEDPMLMKNRTKVLYPAIADMHHTSSFCVERAIRHVISLTWDRGIAQRYEKEYGSSSRLRLPVDKPTSGEFIALLAEYIRPRHRCDLHQKPSRET